MEVHRFAREMGLTHAEFFRTLPQAINHHPHRRNNRSIEIDYGERAVRIELGPEKTRRIASLKLPCVDVTFTFSGFTDAERNAFMERFDLYFRRGGG